MNNQDYEQKKRECWENVKFALRAPNTAREVFEFIFDRAYALGKQTETITQEEIEKAAEEYAAEVDKNVRDLYGIENLPASLTFGECAAESFREGVNFALGKQEKDADTVIQGWVARDEVAIRPTLYTSKPLRQKKGFENGYWSCGMQIGLSLDPSLFPDITWESDPEPVEITIKRKNHEWRTD